MKKIDTLSSLEGRQLLQKIFRTLRYERQMSGLGALVICWRICVYDLELSKYSKSEVRVLHRLGFWSGTALWMEEIVNRYYFSTINSFVYFGAAILLVLIGVRRFSTVVTDTYVIAGIVFEALMLIFMFIVMLFTPKDESPQIAISDETSETPVGELITELGEISRDFAAVSMQFDNLGETMKDMLHKQEVLISTIEKLANSFAAASAPNPQMLETMHETNASLRNFKSAVDELSDTARALKRDEIEMAVRREVEKILIDKLNSDGLKKID